MYTYEGKHTDTYIHTIYNHIQTDTDRQRQTYIQTDINTNVHRYIQTQRQAGIQTHTSRETYTTRTTYRHAEKHIDNHIVKQKRRELQ